MSTEWLASETIEDVIFPQQDPTPLADNPAFGFLSGADWVRVAERTRMTTRELTVAVLMFEGQTRSQIAREIGCAPGTVRVYIDRLFAKLNVQDRVGLVLRIVRVHLAIAEKSDY